MLVALSAVFACEHAYAADESAARGRLSIAAGEGVTSANVAVGPMAGGPSAKTQISSCSISVPKSMSYTGKPLKPRIVVKDGSSVLVEGKDYAVSCKNNRAMGTATVAIEGAGNYTGSIVRNFEVKYSNSAIAVAACRLSYSKSRVKGTKISRSNGYRGTSLYLKYAGKKSDYNCAKVVNLAINKYLRNDKGFPYGVSKQRKHMMKSKNWKRVCKYKEGMEYAKKTKLKPGDVYNDGSHTCIYVGREIASVVYKGYIKSSKATKKKLGKRCADLGKPAKDAVWVSSHAQYMGGTASHICNNSDALADSGGYIYRYVGHGCDDPNGVTR